MQIKEKGSLGKGSSDQQSNETEITQSESESDGNSLKSSGKPNVPYVTMEHNQTTGEEVIMIIDTDESILAHCYGGATPKIIKGTF